MDASMVDFVVNYDLAWYVVLCSLIEKGGLISDVFLHPPKKLQSWIQNKDSVLKALNIHCFTKVLFQRLLAVKMIWINYLKKSGKFKISNSG